MTKLDGKTIAIVGGAGFVGHNMAYRFHQWGADVSVVDNLQVNNLVNVSANEFDLPHRELYLEMLKQRMDLLHERDIPVHVQDARQYHALTEILKEIDPDVIVHLAAVAHADRSNKNPFNTFDHSLRTLENVLDYCRGNVNHLVYFSSSMIYGDFEEDSVTEESQLEPKGIYAALKLSGEEIVKAYNNVFDLDYTIIRPSALYGPRCISRRVGQIFIEKALHGEPIRIDGEGKDRLDFTHIDDLVEGIGLVIDRPESRNEIFNMTYGQARTIIELAEIIEEYFPGIEYNYVERDELKPKRGTLEVDKARDLLGYDPQYPIEKGFKNYIEWYDEILNCVDYEVDTKPTF